uniref:Uncharacterized protein n=1 Tax=Chromera velia CCMP2878 TaxID=1169474 RepID=A0A0G4I0N9_9ALVE|eukprot:Cvel_9995.t1-p1 / transcript=Cvel_9995.t1 / gene=Cvel_9995 / organism=Chromera_velia_CCMP2878 / gene_product=hypothetical protein / transcript_product=hypothetical protein / location=Cvel_scaffold591:60549-64088(+) / protein_length=428 / sequence_SO=supercontig / SO=protein_coding / is_pseudo=false
MEVGVGKVHASDDATSLHRRLWVTEVLWAVLCFKSMENIENAPDFLKSVCTIDRIGIYEDCPSLFSSVGRYFAGSGGKQIEYSRCPQEGTSLLQEMIEFDEIKSTVLHVDGQQEKVDGDGLLGPHEETNSSPSTKKKNNLFEEAAERAPTSALMFCTGLGMDHNFAYSWATVRVHGGPAEQLCAYKYGFNPHENVWAQDVPSVAMKEYESLESSVGKSVPCWTAQIDGRTRVKLDKADPRFIHAPFLDLGPISYSFFMAFAPVLACIAVILINACSACMCITIGMHPSSPPSPSRYRDPEDLEEWPMMYPEHVPPDLGSGVPAYHWDNTVDYAYTQQQGQGQGQGGRGDGSGLQPQRVQGSGSMSLNEYSNMLVRTSLDYRAGHPDLVRVETMESVQEGAEGLQAGGVTVSGGGGRASSSRGGGGGEG